MLRVVSPSVYSASPPPVPSPAYWAVSASSPLRRTLAALGIASTLRLPVGASPSLLQPSRHSCRRREALPHQSRDGLRCRDGATAPLSPLLSRCCLGFLICPVSQPCSPACTMRTQTPQQESGPSTVSLTKAMNIGLPLIHKKYNQMCNNSYRFSYFFSLPTASLHSHGHPIER